MKLLVLIPTYKKSLEDIKNLYNFLNIRTDAIFANQNGENKIEQFELNGHDIKVICSDTIGVSVNRNILLDNAYGDINIFIDDDCPLVDNYETLISLFYSKKPADCCIFNGIWSTHGNKLVHNKKTSRVTKFNQISYAGGPGFTCTKHFSEVNKIKYNEHVGTPNYICAGEDSLFYYELVKARTNVYRSSDVLFNVAIDQTNSSYFNGVDEQYIVTRGFITKKIHPILFFVYKYRHAFRFSRENKELKFCTIIKFLKKGSKLAKEKDKK